MDAMKGPVAQPIDARDGVEPVRHLLHVATLEYHTQERPRVVVQVAVRVGAHDLVHHCAPERAPEDVPPAQVHALFGVVGGSDVLPVADHNCRS